VTARLILPLVLAQLLVHGPLAGEEVGGVATPEAGLDVEDGHVPPAGRAVVAAHHVGAGHAGLVLQQQEQGLHVGPQPGDEARPHHRHRLLVARQQGLQQGAVVPAGGAIVHSWAHVFLHRGEGKTHLSRLKGTYYTTGCEHD